MRDEFPKAWQRIFEEERTKLIKERQADRQWQEALAEFTGTVET